MKSCREMRREAWSILNGKWFWRLLAVGFVLQAIGGFVNGLISSAFAALSIHSLGDYLANKVQAMQAGLGYTLPTLRAYGWMLGGFLLQLFIAYVFGAILVYGFMRTALKAKANDETRWFAEAFDGFLRPFEVTGLLVLLNLKVLFWSLLLVIPGVVATYRYRLAWFLKNEHPDWSASVCLSESGRVMKGFKWKAFCLDLSFVGWLLLIGALIGLGQILCMHGAETGAGWASAAGFLSGALGFYLMVRTLLGLAVSRAVFYRALVPKEG